MSASPWIKESGTGRYYMNWENEYGETVRRYSEELSGGHQANQSSINREDYQTPRSESSTRVAERADYDPASTRYSTSQRPRRDSISFSRTAETSTDYTGRSEPLTIYNESRSGYHRSGGYDQSRDVRVRERPERHDSPPVSESSQTSRRHQVSGRTHDRERDMVHDEVDDLSLGVGKVTVDDLVGSPRYTTVSASAPARSGQWGHVPPRHEATGGTIYEDDKGHEREPPLRSPVQEKLGDDYREKGKAIITNPPETPLMTPAGKRHISGTEGDVEPLDDSYKVRNFDWQKFFRPGRVFSTLWTDAFAGTTNDSENNQFMSSVSYVIYKERVHSKIRRFVVVRLGDRCCTCLPVTTYDGRGSRKRGINLNEHGLIFSSEKKPSSVKGIEKLPLRVRLSKGAERLNNPSYINYGRVYTVETNVKVKDVGELDSESRKYLRAYYNQVNTLPDDDYDGPGPARTPQARAVELAGVGGGIVGPPYSGFSGAQQSTYGPPAPITPMRGNYGGPQDRSASYNQYATSSWTTAGNQQPSTQTTHSAFPLYNPAGSTAPTTVRYSAAPTYDMSRTSSNYQPPDSRYVQTSPTIPNHSAYPSALDSYPRPDPRSTYGGVPAGPSYPSGTLPTGGAYPRRESDDRRDERFVGQSADDRRPPLEPRNSRDSYGSNPSPMERQPSWAPTQAPVSHPDPGYVDPRHNEPQYSERNIDLPTLEEAQASRQRRESVSGRSGGRDREERGDRHRRRR